eukprot:TRINITY_DN27780_c0_g1_i2.p1 TRINITY_DN27780_c0_g1~~TRINITY_DN27780_c0_g1_i2.p1  ORF type:complete len:265 (-),score=24.07 TRINITY_DN27780_c0_g1_i2:68-835(-)
MAAKVQAVLRRRPAGERLLRGARRSSVRNVFITGQPGCGKTHLILAAVRQLQARGVRCKGFVTEEVLQRAGGPRLGFDIVTIPGGRRRPLARRAETAPRSWLKHRTGQYAVDIEALNDLAVEAIRILPGEKLGDVVYVIDEVGRMELHSTAFADAVKSLLTSRRPLLASVAAPRYGHTVPFAEALKARRDARTFQLKRSTRDTVAEAVHGTIVDLPVRMGPSRQPKAAEETGNGAPSRRHVKKRPASESLSSIAQ